MYQLLPKFLNNLNYFRVDTAASQYIAPEQEIGPQLLSLGIRPVDVKWAAPRKLVHVKWKSLGKLEPGGTLEQETDRR